MSATLRAGGGVANIWAALPPIPEQPLRGAGQPALLNHRQRWLEPTQIASLHSPLQLTSLLIFDNLLVKSFC